MIIGITGTNGAGKGSIVNYLVEKKAFVHYSVREYLIHEIKKRGLEINRENMILIANQIRQINSPDYIIEKLYEKAEKEGKDAIIESIRTPAEARFIKQRGVLFAVDADPKIRYSRILKRQSETDNVSYEKFIKLEKKEMFSFDPYKQNLGKCIELADFIIMNNEDFEALYKKIEEIYNKILKKEIQTKKEKSTRPSWDEYFMKVASLVSERSTCLRHHVGAVIVKDKRIIATGYNGAAKNMPDCTELGCLRDELKIPSGTKHEICRAIHAEQNAIIQGAFHGISIKDSIMYCTHTPCMICAKMIVNAGIKEVISYQDYADEDARKFLAQAGVKLRKISKPSKEIIFKD